MVAAAGVTNWQCCGDRFPVNFSGSHLRASESPDFSPIEQCRSKIKTALRAAKARTGKELDKALAQAIGLVSKADIRGWFRHGGYSLARK